MDGRRRLLATPALKGHHMSAQGNALGNDVSLEFEALKGRDRSKGFLIVPQSLSKIYVHLIFGTKNRQATLPQSIREELHAYIGGILNHWESPPVTIASVSDHVHIVFMLSRNHPIRRIVEEVKKSSSKWLKGKAGIAASFQWQNGYGAFSVSQS